MVSRVISMVILLMPHLVLITLLITTHEAPSIPGRKDTSSMIEHGYFAYYVAWQGCKALSVEPAFPVC